jgi:hypothetical protein
MRSGGRRGEMTSARIRIGALFNSRGKRNNIKNINDKLVGEEMNGKKDKKR